MTRAGDARWPSHVLLALMCQVGAEIGCPVGWGTGKRGGPATQSGGHPDKSGPAGSARLPKYPIAREICHGAMDARGG